MVKKSIKIYSRLKNEKPENSISYQVHQQDDCQTITIYLDQPAKFEKVIAAEATQEEVFNVIAKPVVKSVLKGYNGTIFAYGQTGSGKTYAMTGSPEKYEQRGLIPRSIEEIFQHINKTSQKYTICISYLEIYNEIGYDLLNPRQTPTVDDVLGLNGHKNLVPLSRQFPNPAFSTVVSPVPALDMLTSRPTIEQRQNLLKKAEWLSIDSGNYTITNNEFVIKNRARKVSLHDYGNGEFHLRNLTIQKVSTEHEAMKLLLEGDANRITVETPMNMYSSRSHCIFTIAIAAKNGESGKVRRSKLTLVDLAGSERVCKTNVTGATLHEAKHINLSLHYLEQVVVALSQKKVHVPFRNSMLTYLLKDSLSGNCMAVLLATITVSNKNMGETLATCKFAQRVADVSIDPEVNEEIDPNHEIQHLKREIERLRKQVIQQAQIHANEKLTKEEQEKWRKFVNGYLISSKDELPMTPYDVRHVQYCFRLLKQAVKDHEAQKLQIKSAENANKELADQYREQIKIREKEINYLKALLHVEDEEIVCPPSRQNTLAQIDKENIRPSISSVLSKNESVADNKNTSEMFKEKLNSRINTSQSKQSISTNDALSPAQKIAFEVFVKDPENRGEIDFYKKSIDDLYGLATNVASALETCQRNIMSLKGKHSIIDDPVEQSKIDSELNNEQTIYRNSLAKLHDIKNETKCQRKALDEAKQHIMLNFKRWYDSIDVNTSPMDNKFHHDNFLEISKAHVSASRNRPPSPSRYYDSVEIPRKDYNKINFITQVNQEHRLNNSFDEKTVKKREDSRSRFVDYILNFDMQSKEAHKDNLYENNNNICRHNPTDFNACHTVNRYTDRKIMVAGSERPHSAHSEQSHIPIASNEYHTHSHGHITPNHRHEHIHQHFNTNHTHESQINESVTNRGKNPKVCTESPHRNFPKANSFADRRQPPTKPFCQSSSYPHNNNFSDVKSNTVPRIDLVRNHEGAAHKSIMRKSDEHEVELHNYVFKTVPLEQDSLVSSNIPQVFRAYPPKKVEEHKTRNLPITEDSQAFKDFMKNIPLTGDPEIDEEIVHFYRTKFNETKTM